MTLPYSGMPVNFGRAIPSGSHCGTYRSFLSGGGNTNISIKSYNYGNGCCGAGNIFDAAYYGGGGCCHGGGSSDKAVLTALGVGAGIGLLSGPLGGAVMKGVGTGFKYLGLGFKYAGIGIGKAAAWTLNKAIKPTCNFMWNSVLKPVGEGLWNGVKATGKGIGEFFTRLGRFCIGKGWSLPDKTENAK